MIHNDLNWLLLGICTIGLGISALVNRLVRIAKALERIADAYEEAHK